MSIGITMEIKGNNRNYIEHATFDEENFISNRK